MITAAEAQKLSVDPKVIAYKLSYIDSSIRTACETGYTSVQVGIENDEMRDLVANEIRAKGYRVKESGMLLDIKWSN